LRHTTPVRPICVRRGGSTTVFDVIDPILGGFEFVVAHRGGKRALIVRDGQHEYVFAEAGARSED